MPIQLSSSGDSAVLTLPSLAVSNANAVADTVSVPLFAGQGTATPQQNGGLTITALGQTVKATAIAMQLIPVPNVDTATMSFANGQVSLPSGAQDSIAVGVSQQGVMVVKVSASVREGLNDRQLAVLAMAIGKQELNVDAAAVRAVVIEVE